MKTLTRSIAVLLLLSASLLAQAPNMAGQWQGVLQAGKDLRIVVVITSADGLKATMYSIDQTPQGIPASAITVQGTTLRMSFGGIGVRFEGTVSADGNSVTGTFTQGNKPLPMTLARTNTDTAWKIPEPPKADGGRREGRVRGGDDQAEQPCRARQAVHDQGPAGPDHQHRAQRSDYASPTVSTCGR